MTTAFQPSAFQNNAFQIDVAAIVVTGGKGDNERRRYTYKPTGLGTLRLKKKGQLVNQSVEARIAESGLLHADAIANAQREFLEDVLEQPSIVQMSAADIEREIGVLLKQKIRTEDEEIILLLMLAAVA